MFLDLSGFRQSRYLGRADQLFIKWGYKSVKYRMGRKFLCEMSMGRKCEGKRNERSFEGDS